LIVWVQTYNSTPGTSTINYSPTDVFVTYPLPGNCTNLDTIGAKYHEHRRYMMIDKNAGLTATNNRYHDRNKSTEDLVLLRDLQEKMDYAIASAYCSDDLDLCHDFYETPKGVRFTMSEEARREVLSRLLDLNHQRYEEEVAAGLHEKKNRKKESRKKGKSKKSSVKDMPEQYNLL